MRSLSRSSSLLLALTLLVPGVMAAQDSPVARRVDQVDVLFGRRIADPYRWMEQPSSEVTSWITSQDRTARAFASGFSGRDRLRDIITRAAKVDRFSPVTSIGDQHYLVQADGSFSRRSLIMVRPDGRDSTIISDADLPSGSRLTSISISPNGQTLAYGVSEGGATIGGSSWSEIRFRDLKTGRDLPDRLTGLYGAGTRSGMAWLPDASGIYYERYPIPANAGERLTARLGAERLFFHRMGTIQRQDLMVYDPGNPDITMTTSVSVDGRHLVIGAGIGGAVENRVLVGSAAMPGTQLKALVDTADAAYLYLGSRGDTLWFQTTAAAPNWRIIAIHTSYPQQNHWIETVAEREDAMEPTIGAAMVGDRFIVGYRHNAWMDVKVFETSGRKAYDLQLPKIASIWTGFVGPQHQGRALYTVTDFADPGTLYNLDVATGTSTVVRRPTMAYDPDDFVIRQVVYQADDGTSIPMFIASKRSADDSATARRPRPLILYGYGAFSWAASPWFRPDLVGWMESGGVFAMPNIRGGGEFGESWHLAGVTTKKQRTIDDYLAAAEYLVKEGYTTRGMLVGNGGSASGAVVGAAMVQRPDIFAAITLDYPALDMIRLDQFTGGRQWRSEFGSTEIKDELEALLAYSPYHNVKPGVCYPATLVLPGEVDQTTVPMHAYKFVAAMQNAQACERPIMLRVSWGAGHTAGANLEDSIENWADQLAFLIRVLKLPAS
jgi:prolyl oligopeptidase